MFCPVACLCVCAGVVQFVGVVESERIVSYFIYAHLVGVCVVGVVFGVVKVVCRFPVW